MKTVYNDDAGDPAFAPDRLDQPEYEGDRSYYMICSTPRTGSNVLCELLTLNGVGAPMEYFHSDKYMPVLYKRYGLSPSGQDGSVDVETYIEALKRYRTTPNGYFGFKAHWRQFKWLKQQCNVEARFPDLKYILITRQDELAQAVSASKAAFSGQWNSSQRVERAYRYDGAHIEGCLRLFRQNNARWREYFQSHRIRPLHLTYEALVSSTEGVVKDILDFLDVPYDSIKSNLDGLMVRRQFDAVNRRWIQRYKEEHPEEFQ